MTDVRAAFHRQCPRCAFPNCWKSDLWDTDETARTMTVPYACPVCGLVFSQVESLDDGEAPGDGQGEDLAAPPIKAWQGGEDA